MSRDQPRLTAAVDEQLDVLTSFCLDLIAIAVDADIALRP